MNDNKQYKNDTFNTDVDDLPYIRAVEGLLGGVGTLRFEDGTVQFAHSYNYPDVVYSPRLPKLELEVFCKKNILYYEKHLDENIDAMDLHGETPPIRKFW